MSWTTRDLRCVEHPDEHYACSVVFNTNDGPPPCACGAEQTTFYATREMEGKAAQDKLDASLAHFGPVKYDGRWMTRQELAQIKNDYADRQGVPRDILDFTSMGNKTERAEDRRHRAVETRRRNGYDEQQFREHQRGEH